MYETEHETAIEAVLEACRLCEQVRSTLVSGETLAKKDRSPVTVADFGAQALVIRQLMRAFPGDPVVGEEDAAELRALEGAGTRSRVVEAVRAVCPETTEADILDAIDYGLHAGGPAGRFWTLDPIDGTKGFLRGEQYAVALALVEEGQVVLGVLGCPNLPRNADQPDGPRGTVFAAARGTGTRMRSFDGADERPVRVSSVDDPRDASFCESVESGHSSHDDAGRIAALLGVQAPPVRMDSQAKYGTVARGEASIYLRLPTAAGYQERIWDHAAGWIVVTEAGGEVTDVRGAPLDFSAGRALSRNTGVVATNGRLHASVLQAVRAVLG